MIYLIIYTILLLFVDKQGAASQTISALRQWFETMIPALFPMMLYSSILVDTGFAQKVGNFLNRLLLKPFRLSNAGAYCLLTGFLFGFPMGAKTTADLCQRKALSKEEGTYLLTFINCIGPMYTLHLVQPAFSPVPLWKLLTGIYGIPLLYGLILRYCLYGNCSFHLRNASKEPPNAQVGFWSALYSCVPKCAQSILNLGGYMVLFQILYVPLMHFQNSINWQEPFLYPLLEITGGLTGLPADTNPGLVLFYVIWGGGCCFVQTYSFLKPAGLSARNYLLHKTILALLGAAFGFFI